MTKFENIHPDVAEILREKGFSEDDLFTQESDLYVGCKNLPQAIELRKNSKWSSMAATFIPQPGSGMEQFPAAVSIALGAIKQHI